MEKMYDVNKVMEVRDELKNNDVFLKLVDFNYILSKIDQEDFDFYLEKISALNNAFCKNCSGNDVVNWVTKFNNNELPDDKLKEVLTEAFDSYEDFERFCNIYNKLLSKQEFRDYCNIIDNNPEESSIIMESEIQVTKEQNSNLS